MKKKQIALALILVLSLGTACQAEDAFRSEIQDRGEIQINTQQYESPLKDITTDITQEELSAIEQEIAKYEKVNKNIIKQAPKIKKFNKSDIQSKEAENNYAKTIKINLKDGDYVYWIPSGKSEDIAFEYHANGDLMGFLKIHTGEKYNYKSIIYEYRISNPTFSIGRLQHVMIIGRNSKFIYTAKGQLRAAQVGNTVISYDNLGMPTTIVRINIKNNKNNDTLASKIKQWHDNNIFHDDSGYERTSTAVTLCLFSCYGGVTAFIIPPIVLGAWALSELLYWPALGTAKVVDAIIPAPAEEKLTETSQLQNFLIHSLEEEPSQQIKK